MDQNQNQSMNEDPIIINTYATAGTSEIQINSDGVIEIVLADGSTHQVPPQDLSQKYIWIYSDDIGSIIVATSDLDHIFKYISQHNVLYSEITEIVIESTSRSKNLYVEKNEGLRNFKTPIKQGIENRIAVELQENRLVVYFERSEERLA